MATGRNKFKFGQSSLFDKNQFGDLYRAQVGSQLEGLRAEKNLMRRDRGRELANFRALTNRLASRTRNMSQQFANQREASQDRFDQRRASMEDAARTNLDFLRGVFGSGLENQGDPTVENQIAAGAQDAGMEEARRLEQQMLEEDLSGRVASGEQAIAQQRAAAYNNFLERSRSLAAELQAIKKARPLIAQDIRERLENRGIALEELGLSKAQFAEGQRQFNEELGLRKAELGLSRQQFRQQSKATQAELKGAWTDTIMGVLGGGTSEWKVPMQNPDGSYTTVTQTKEMPRPESKAKAISQAVSLGVPRNVATRVVNAFWPESASDSPNLTGIGQQVEKLLRRMLG